MDKKFLESAYAEAKKHPKGLIIFMKDLEFEILQRALNEYISIARAHLTLRIHRSTMSEKLLGLMKRGYVFVRKYPTTAKRDNSSVN